jgi:predicted nucleic acid-binding protein
MKAVVDTNILFSFFWEESLTRRMLVTSSYQLISPKIALDELVKYKEDIIKKTGINVREFKNYFSELKQIIKFVDKVDYGDFIEDAIKISPDKKDADFFALCLKESCFLWSNDNLLKRQSRINVFSTKEIIDFLF